MTPRQKSDRVLKETMPSIREQDDRKLGSELPP